MIIYSDSYRMLSLLTLSGPGQLQVHVPYEDPWSAQWLVPNDLVLQVTARRQGAELGQAYHGPIDGCTNWGLKMMDFIQVNG
jgi:hypothetical protein